MMNLDERHIQNGRRDEMPTDKGYLAYNQDRWNRVSRKKGNPYTIPIEHEELMELKQRPLEVGLTVGRPVPARWFKRAKGMKTLKTCGANPSASLKKAGC